MRIVRFIWDRYIINCLNIWFNTNIDQEEELDHVVLKHVNQFKDVWFSYDAPAGFTLELYTDMGAGDPQRTIVFPATTGTEKHTRSCESSGALLEGTLIRPRITSTGTSRLGASS